MKAVQLRILAVTVALGLGAATTAQAQHKGATGSITSKSNAPRGTGKNENIKKDDAVNSTSATPMPAPAAKGGPKARGAAALTSVHVDNQTGWIIRLYVDGDYNGSVGPYGDVYAYIPCDDHILYAEARFTDGSVKSWGPSLANTCSSDLVWHLVR